MKTLCAALAACVLASAAHADARKDCLDAMAYHDVMVKRVDLEMKRVLVEILNVGGTNTESIEFQDYWRKRIADQKADMMKDADALTDFCRDKL